MGLDQAGPDADERLYYILQRSWIICVHPLTRVNALQTISLLIFAALAAVVLFNLYGVLGKRVGRQPDDGPAQAPLVQSQDSHSARLDLQDEVALSGLAAVRAKDPTFEVDAFLNSARETYETIVKAFAGNDRQTLKGLTDDGVYATFSQAIDAREAQGLAETVEFVNPARADLEAAELDEDRARIRVRFLSEFRSRPAADTQSQADADERRAAEMWTFERLAGAKDSPWILHRVEPAEA